MARDSENGCSTIPDPKASAASLRQSRGFWYPAVVTRDSEEDRCFLLALVTYQWKHVHAKYCVQCGSYAGMIHHVLSVHVHMVVTSIKRKLNVHVRRPHASAHQHTRD